MPIYLQVLSQKNFLLRFLRAGVLLWIIYRTFLILGFWLNLSNLPGAWITQFVDVAQYSITPWVPWAGAAISLLSIYIHFLLCLNLIRLLNCWMDGNIFSEQTTRLFSELGLFYLLCTVADILTDSLNTFLLTMGNPSGQRIIAFGFNSSDLLDLGAACFLYVMAIVMRQAYQLQQDANLTI